MTELYKKHRPSKLSELFGQGNIVQQVQGFIKNKRIPHTLLLTGPSGCGKTTLARILVTELKCSTYDFVEVNCADNRGIDLVRDIKGKMNYSPMKGTTKIWLLDECHQLTKEAQSAFLKILEDTPKHVYFMLATTDPSKLLPTIKTRSTEIKMSSLTPKLMGQLLTHVASKEKIILEDEVTTKLIDIADGSPRKALVLLDQIAQLSDVNEQLETLAKADIQKQSIDLARSLINPRPNWHDICKILKSIDDEPEAVRRIVLGYANSVLLGNGKLSGRAISVIESFQYNFFDSGKAGLSLAAYQACHNS